MSISARRLLQEKNRTGCLLTRSVASTIRAEEGILRQGVGAGGRRADCCAGGVIVTAGGTAAHRKLIIDLVNRYKLPTVYPYRYYAVDGDLITYGRILTNLSVAPQDMSIAFSRARNQVICLCRRQPNTI